MSHWHFWSKLFSRSSAQRWQRSPKQCRLLRIQRSRPLLAEPLEARLCLSAVTNYVWTANQIDNTISKIDKTTNAVVATIPSGVPQYAFGVAVDEDSVWVG